MFIKILDTENEVIYRASIGQLNLDYKFIPVWDIADSNDRWLAFKNLQNLPAKRLMVFQHINELERIGMQKVELIKVFSEIKEACKAEDTHSAYASANYAESKLKDHWDISKSMRAIIPLVFIKESQVEFISEYNTAICDANMKEIEMNEQMLEVFFYIVQKHIEHSSENALQPSLDYLTEIVKIRTEKSISPQTSDSEKKNKTFETLTALYYKYVKGTSS